MEGMIERNDGRCLRHSVALNEYEAERVPGLLERSGQRAAAGNNRPELQSELAMHSQEAHPAPRRAKLSLRAGHALRESLMRGFKMRLEQSQHARNSREHGDALLANHLNKSGSSQAALKMQLRFENRRNPKPHGLPVDVAQRQGVKNAQRVHQLFVAHVRLCPVFNRTNARKHVAVRDHNALGVAGGAGGEQNLKWRSGGKPGYRQCLGCRQCALPALKRQEGKLWSSGCRVPQVSRLRPG